MELHSDDDAFVRAPVSIVYRRLTHVAAWNDWWPGLEVVAEPARSDDPAESDRFRVLGHPRPWRRLELEAVATGWRHESGFSLRLAGDIDGRGEFWLERVPRGTVVHHVMLGTTARRRPLVVLDDYRRLIRWGLWAFGDRIQGELRTSAGLTP